MSGIPAIRAAFDQSLGDLPQWGYQRTPADRAGGLVDRSPDQRAKSESVDQGAKGLGCQANRCR